MAREGWIRYTQLDAWGVSLLFVYRILNAMCVQTYFVPDEYWQGAEVAHRLVFGYGYLTWEWRHGLRSSIHPLIIAAFYKLAQVTGTDYLIVLRLIPRVLSGTAAALGDAAVFELARRIFGRTVAWQALACQLMSASYFYCMSRSLSNSLETALTLGALALWPWQMPIQGAALVFDGGAETWSRRLGLLLAVLSFVVRPTSAVVFTPLVLRHIVDLSGFSLRPARVLSSPRQRARIISQAFPRQTRLFVTECMAALGLGLMLLLAADRISYGRWIFSTYNFFAFNVQGGASLYGRHPWYWYLSERMRTNAPASSASERCLLLPLVSSTLIHSALPHKEFRFLLPLLPMALCYAGKGLEVLGESGKQLATSSSRLQNSAWAPWLKIMTGVKNLNGPAGSSELINPRPRGGRKRARSNSPMARSKSPVSTVDGYSPLKESTSWSKSRHFGSRSAENASPSPRDGKRQASKGAHSRATRPGKWWWTITVVAVTQFLAAFYLSLVHQRGAVDVIKWIAQQAQGISNEADMNVLFLMPCHSTPFYSEVHRKIRMRSLDCSPAAHRPKVSLDGNCSDAVSLSSPSVLDEADRCKPDATSHEQVCLDICSGCEMSLSHPEILLEMTSAAYVVKPDSMQTPRASSSAPSTEVPTHVVCFEGLASSIQVFLQKHGYKRARRLFHAHLPLESRLSTHILVYSTH